ncbi:MAG TPA: hypothetical protein VHZ73_13890 [Vicinamibacterales bacterium]|jgi:hypothetical protein|nr:hypothetical protein [Vicinamibacterales bacterium]
MDLKALKLFTIAGAVALAAAACGKASPAQPSSTTGGTAGTSYTAPGGIAPADKAQIAYASQPIFMIISNSAASSGQATSYSFEVATDSAFTQKVYTRDNLSAEQGGGVTHQAIDAKLPGATTYYWHTKVTSGTSVGPYGPTYSFTVGPEIQLGTPAQSLPVNGGDSTTPVTLTTQDVTRSGPASGIQYKFEVSTVSSFTSIAYTATIPETAGSTTATITVTQGAGTVLYWRVTAIDASGITSAISPIWSFKVNNFDIRTALIFDSPPDLGQWQQTARITDVNISPDAMLVDFDRRTGANAWPDQPFGDGGGGTLQYTLGMCLQIGGGQWGCSAVVQFWTGRDLAAGGSPYDVASNWFYDVRWGALKGHQPAEGETVGFFVASGNLRNNGYTLATCPGTCERSNVALVPFTYGNADYAFSVSKGPVFTVLRKK